MDTGNKFITNSLFIENLLINKEERISIKILLLKFSIEIRLQFINSIVIILT